MGCDLEYFKLRNFLPEIIISPSDHFYATLQSVMVETSRYRRETKLQIKKNLYLQHGEKPGIRLNNA